MDNIEAAELDAAAQPRAAATTSGRRRMLAAGAGGLAVSLLPWLASSARAATDTTIDTSTSDETVPDSAAATTTTAPPRKPTADDIEVLSFAQTVELAARDLYDVALDADVFDEALVGDITTIREAHEAYAQSLSGFIGRHAPNARNDALYDELSADFGGADAAAAAAALENALVATHLEVLNVLEGIDGAALIASILVVESRHATVLNGIAGATSLDDQLAGDAEAINPTDYPLN